MLFLERIGAALTVVTALIAAVWTASSPEAWLEKAQAAPTQNPSPPALRMLHDVIYVVVPNSDKNPAIAIGIASELNKFTKDAWVIPDLSSPDAAFFSARCNTDPKVNANPKVLGFLVVTVASQETDRFYIILSRQASHLYPFVQVVACPSASADKRPDPIIIGIISQLHSAHDTPWVIRKSELSVPLVSYAGVATALSKNGSNTNSNANLAIAAGELAGGTYNIPGYNPGTRLLHATQRLADDLLGELRFFCGRPDVHAAGAKLCDAFNENPRDQ